MSLVETGLLLFLVVDPFGNLPFVLGVLDNAAPDRYRRIITRETVLAFGLLGAFALGGEQMLGYLNIERASLSVAGGVILFLISLKMIFRSAGEIFEERYRDDPLLVPIAVPALAGPSAMTTVMILSTHQAVPLGRLLGALGLVFAAAWLVFLLGRHISTLLGHRGIKAMEKLFGLLLNLIAVNMILTGVKDYLYG